jgi:hypothetical protein
LQNLQDFDEQSIQFKHGHSSLMGNAACLSPLVIARDQNPRNKLQIPVGNPMILIVERARIVFK